jgi:hypothetical protein
VLRVAKVDQSVQVRHCLKDDITPAPAITAVGTAEFDVFLSPEGGNTITAVTRPHIDLCLV